MKQVIKRAAALAAYLFIIWGLCAQVHPAERADIVVLMDTSGTILPYYRAINDQVLHSIITRFVRKGDTFHLLSFNAAPHYEMSQTIITEADLSRVVSRFMLLYQLGNNADFLSGLHFTAAYMKTLPPQRSKTIIVISDGIFNPPPESPYTGYTDEHIKTELAKITADIRHNQWSVYYVKLPFPQEAVIKNLDGTFYSGRYTEADLVKPITGTAELPGRTEQTTRRIPEHKTAETGTSTGEWGFPQPDSCSIPARSAKEETNSVLHQVRADKNNAAEPRRHNTHNGKRAVPNKAVKQAVQNSTHIESTTRRRQETAQPVDTLKPASIITALSSGAEQAAEARAAADAGVPIADDAAAIPGLSAELKNARSFFSSDLQKTYFHDYAHYMPEQTTHRIPEHKTAETGTSTGEQGGPQPDSRSIPATHTEPVLTAPQMQRQYTDISGAFTAEPRRYNTHNGKRAVPDKTVKQTVQNSMHIESTTRRRQETAQPVDTLKPASIITALSSGAEQAAEARAAADAGVPIADDAAAIPGLSEGLKNARSFFSSDLQKTYFHDYAHYMPEQTTRRIPEHKTAKTGTSTGEQGGPQPDSRSIPATNAEPVLTAPQMQRQYTDISGAFTAEPRRYNTHNGKRAVPNKAVKQAAENSAHIEPTTRRTQETAQPVDTLKPASTITALSSGVEQTAEGRAAADAGVPSADDAAAIPGLSAELKNARSFFSSDLQKTYFHDYAHYMPEQTTHRIPEHKTAETGTSTGEQGVPQPDSRSIPATSAEPVLTAPQMQRQYTDISGAFTANLGIHPDTLPESGAVVFTDQRMILPEITLPQVLTASGTRLTLPLQFKHTAETPLDIHLCAVAVVYGAVTSQLLPDSHQLVLQPETQTEYTLTLTLPEFFRIEGHYSADIRIECIVNNTHSFSHAETVQITITAPRHRQLLRKITQIPLPIAQAVILGVITFVLLLITSWIVIRYRALLRKPSSEKPAATRTGQEAAKNSRRYSYPATVFRTSAQSPCISSEVLELFVENQNTAIGKRNIHLLKTGMTMTVGGSKRDDFLIFLVPFPAALAEINYDGSQYTLLVKRPEFFPGLQATVIADCIGKMVTIISDKGYPVSFMFRGYQDPTAQLNALLTSIQKKR